MKQIISILLLFGIANIVLAKQALPQLNHVTHIEISSSTLDTIAITNTSKINQITDFLNKYHSSWAPTQEYKSETSLTLSFFSNQQRITDIGITSQSINQLYGKQWSQPIPKNIMKWFAGSIHPVIEETLFPIIPMDFSSEENLNHWKQKINQLQSGIDHRKIKSFLQQNKIRIKQVNNHTTEDSYWLNLELSLINDGHYVDTIIAARMFLNKDHSLKSTQFLGYQIAKKNTRTKHLTSNINAASY